MTTDYDPIAEQYKRSKLQPWRTFIEAFTLLELVGRVDALAVLDVACGEGFYTRALASLRPARVVGVDLSAGMIELARKQEAAHGLGIEYFVGDARNLGWDGQFDLVVAAYLLNYARDRDELGAMCAGIARCLKPGGRFVTVNCSPTLDFSAAPSYRKYGFETQRDRPVSRRRADRLEVLSAGRDVRDRELSPGRADPRRQLCGGPAFATFAGTRRACRR